MVLRAGLCCATLRDRLVLKLLLKTTLNKRVHDERLHASKLFVQVSLSALFYTWETCRIKHQYMWIYTARQPAPRRTTTRSRCDRARTTNDDMNDDQEDDKRSSWLGQEKADCGQSQCFSVVFNQFSHKKSIKSTDPGQVTDDTLQLRGGCLEALEERRIQGGRVAHRCLKKPKQARELGGRHVDRELFVACTRFK